MSQEAKAVVRRVVEEAQEGRRIELVDELFSPDFVDHSPLPGLPPTRDGIRALFGALHSAFPDLRVAIHDQIGEGERVATRKSFSGTHEGEFLNVPASGRRVEFEVVDILRVVDGRVTDHWCVVDQLALLQQLGAIA